MKKFLSILLVLAMVLSLSIAAFAAENTGSITITNATINETYAAYKIFDASISADDDGNTDAVSYSIKPDSQFFDVLFGTNGTGKQYFDYNANTGTVTKVKGVNDAALTNYLTGLVTDPNANYEAAASDVAENKVVKFEGLEYGYYLITSSLGAMVTINSNTPDVSVIDKNQKPGKDFDKLVLTSEGEWKEENSANIGDEITYKIEFEATNYDGDKQIKYYQIHDEKGNAIWADFDSFEVYVDGKLLPRGYYLDQANLDNGDWKFLNENVDHADSWKNLTQEKKVPDNAQWYLVHLGEDQFRITIPWLTNHHLNETVGANGAKTYSLTFGEGAVSKFESPVNVKIVYDAVVEANASIGDTTHGNRYNKAYASWTSEYETGSTTPEEVVTRVYGIGLLKDDIATGENLAGAKFRIYRDADCTEEVFVIPTKIAGVYIVDSYGTALDRVSGVGKQTSRELFADYLADYLGTATQDNYAVSQVNGKLAILGLEAGTYYLKEVEAPNGYNALTQPIEIKAGENIRPFIIYADEDGNVADIQAEDGVHKEYRLDLTHTVVHNSKGVVLPSTGGEGTFWLITIGTMLAIGFAVFLITHKKMSVYVD